MISYRLCGLCVSLDRQSNGFLGNIGKHRLCIVRGQSSLPYSGLLLNLNMLSFLMRFKAIAHFVIDNRSSLKKKICTTYVYRNLNFDQIFIKLFVQIFLLKYFKILQVISSIKYFLPYGLIVNKKVFYAKINQFIMNRLRLFSLFIEKHCNANNRY